MAFAGQDFSDVDVGAPTPSNMSSMEHSGPFSHDVIVNRVDGTNHPIDKFLLFIGDSLKETNNGFIFKMAVHGGF